VVLVNEVPSRVKNYEQVFLLPVPQGSDNLASSAIGRVENPHLHTIPLKPWVASGYNVMALQYLIMSSNCS